MAAQPRPLPPPPPPPSAPLSPLASACVRALCLQRLHQYLHLPPSPAPTAQVSGFGGKISLTNTLQSRLMLAYETRLPKLRAALFA